MQLNLTPEQIQLILGLLEIAQNDLGSMDDDDEIKDLIKTIKDQLEGQSHED